MSMHSFGVITMIDIAIRLGSMTKFDLLFVTKLFKMGDWAVVKILQSFDDSIKNQRLHQHFRQIYHLRPRIYHLSHL